MATLQVPREYALSQARRRAALPLPWLRHLLSAMAAGYLALYIGIACQRMSYPYELEWLEGACLDQVRWILAGKPLYVPPSIDFVPFCYTPLYFYVSAATCQLLGVSFFPLRLVSFIASLGCFVLLFAFVRRQTGSARWGLVAAGLYAGAYRVSGAWFDVARVDSLFILLLLAGVYLVRFGHGVRPLLLAGVLMSLAFLTKQTAVLVAGLLTIYCLFGKRRGPALAYMAAFGLITGISIVLLEVSSDGWFSYYVFSLPSHHKFTPLTWATFWTLDIGRPLAIALALSIVCAFSQPRADRQRQRLFYVLVPGGMLGMAWLGRLHEGGYDNVLLPGYALLCLCFAVGCHALQSYWQQARADAAECEHTLPPGERTGLERNLLRALYCIGIFQFALLAYIPKDQIPTNRDCRSGNRLIEWIRRIDGEVLIVHHGYLSAMAGKPTFCQFQAVSDVLRGPDEKVAGRLMDEIREALASRRFAAVIIDEPWWLQQEMERNYENQGMIIREANTFWPVTGIKMRPMVLYSRRP